MVRTMAAVPGRSMCSAVDNWPSAMQMKMKRQMPMVSAQQERKHAEGNSHSKADEIEIGPRHSDRLLTYPSKLFRAPVVALPASVPPIRECPKSHLAAENS